MNDPIDEFVARHNDAELVKYLYSKAVGIQQAYKKSLDTNTTERLWAVVGDQAEMARILKKMNERNQERLAQVE